MHSIKKAELHLPLQLGCLLMSFTLSLSIRWAVFASVKLIRQKPWQIKITIQFTITRLRKLFTHLRPVALRPQISLGLPPPNPSGGLVCIMHLCSINAVLTNFRIRLINPF